MISKRRPLPPAVYNDAMRLAHAIAFVVLLAASPAVSQIVVPSTMGVPAAAETVPGQAHDLALQALAAGDYVAAMDVAERDYRGSIRIGAARWIDSIASSTVVGECQFELGQLPEALARYDEAMLLYAAHPDWLLSVHLPPQVGPRGGPRAGTFGRSERTTVPAAIPDVVTMRQQSEDPQEVLKHGGVLAADYDRTVRPQELMRMLVIAIYRHGSLLGEVARASTALDAATKSLLKRPAAANHWSQAWIDVALGAALWAQGKPDQAAPLLTRGIAIGNQFDHALTPWGLIILGRMAIDADQAQRATKLLDEACLAAAEVGDARALEEAFALATQAHSLAGTKGIPPSIRDGATWARGRLPALHARLLAIEAELAMGAGNLRAATSAVKAIDGRLLRSEAGRGELGSLTAYARGRIEYAGGNTAAGDRELTAALAIAAGRSPKLLQIRRLAELVQAGATAFSDRQADALFAALLSDPTPRDSVATPRDALARLSTPHADAFDTWVAVAARRSEEAAIEASEAAMRHRWLSSQPLGGRRVAVQHLLDADPETLPPEAAACRASILGSLPHLAADADELGQLQRTIAAALAAGPERGDAVSLGNRVQELAARRRAAIDAIAAARTGIPLAFPPLTQAAEIRRRLQPKQLILSFHWTGVGLFAVLESHDRFTVWTVRQAGALPSELKALARSLGLHDASAPIPAANLDAEAWHDSAARIERMLFENSKVALGEGIDELVIVPDGWLWYLPFELLPVGTSRPDDAARLRDVCRIRYAPTRSLAVMAFSAPTRLPIGIHVGRMARGESRDDIAATSARLLATIPGSVPLGGATIDIPLAASACGSIAVFDELTGPGPGSTGPLLPIGGGPSAVSFREWLGPPAKRPTLVALPGLQTSMARGLDAPPGRPGDELFLATTDLIAAGARTALVSRWGMGGQTSSRLLGEFLREATASDALPMSLAWQRAVDLIMVEEPDLAREPRVRAAAGDTLQAPLHPLLWSGYALVDCGPGHPPADAAPPRGAP